MRLLTLNVQHTGVTRADRVVSAVTEEHPDVVVLTELKPGPGADRVLSGLRDAGLEFAEVGVIEHAELPYTVAVASRWPIVASRSPFLASRYVQAALEVQVRDLTIVALYFPLNGSRPRNRDHDAFWADAFVDYAASLADGRVVMVGDWNTGSGTLDIGGGSVPGMARFDGLVASGWLDAWRSQHPGTSEFTWHSQRGGNGFRLDHALLSPLLAGELAGSRYVHSARINKVSDHSALVIDLIELAVAEAI